MGHSGKRTGVKANPPHISAGLVFLLSVSVLVGWFVGSERLVQVHPSFAPMQFNTALLFMFSAIGLYVLSQFKSRLAIACGALVMLTAALTLAQYIFVINLGIDELLWKHTITTNTSHPGRMAPNTAACFLIMGGGLLFAALLKKDDAKVVIEETAGFLILALSAMALLGYLNGLDSAYGWSQLTRMALHTAICFIVLGTGLLSLAWRRDFAVQSALQIGAIATFSFLVILLDFYSVLGSAIGIAYLPLVVLGIWFSRPSAPIILAIFSTVLIVLGFFVARDSAAPTSDDFAIRAASVFAIWMTAFLVFYYRGTNNKLQAKELQLSEMIDASHDGFWDWRIEDNREYMSPRFWEIFGYKAGDKKPLPSEWKNLLLDEDLDKWNDAIAIHLSKKGEKPVDVQLRFRHKDGSVVTVLRRGNVIEWDEDTNPTRMVGAHTDITKQINIQNSLSEHKSRLELAAKSADIGIWEWNLVTGNLEWDDRLYAMYELNPDQAEITYDQWKTFVNTDDLAVAETAVQEALAGADQYYAVFRITTGLRNARTIEAHAFVERDDNGEACRMVGLNLDITTKRELELSREKLVEELSESNAELERFAYVASHDLQEPLRMVTNFTQLVSDRYSEQLDETGQEYIRFAVDGAKRMHVLIMDILEYSRLGQGEEVFQELNIEEVIGRAEQNLSSAITESGAKISHDPLPIIRGSGVKMTRLFQNLIGNGIKYQASGVTPQIHISAKQVDQSWIFSVRDNGIGVSQEYQAQIFLPFKRLHRSHEFSGTGIGLAICKKIVESHGGIMGVHSKKGEGSEFYFTIPIEMEGVSNERSDDQARSATR